MVSVFGFDPKYVVSITTRPATFFSCGSSLFKRFLERGKTDKRSVITALGRQLYSGLEKLVISFGS